MQYIYFILIQNDFETFVVLLVNNNQETLESKAADKETKETVSVY